MNDPKVVSDAGSATPRSLEFLARTSIQDGAVTSIAIRAHNEIERLSILVIQFDNDGNRIGGGGTQIADALGFGEEIVLDVDGTVNSPHSLRPVVENAFALALFGWESIEASHERAGFLFIGGDPKNGLPPIKLPSIPYSIEEILRAQESLEDTLESLGSQSVLNESEHARMKTKRETKKRARQDQNCDFAKSLTIGGYRGFSSRQRINLAIPDGVSFGSGLTVVVGANNSGKSALWEAFDAIARATKGHDLTFPASRRNKGSDEGVYLKLEKQSGSAIVLRSETRDSAFTQLEVSAEDGEKIHNTHNLLQLWALPARRQFEAYFAKVDGNDVDWSTRSGEYSRTALRNDFVELLVNIHRDSSKAAEFDDYIERILGYGLEWGIDAIETQNGQSFFINFANSDGTSHSSEGLGEGIVSLLFILASLFLAKPGTIIAIDEPEVALHPKLIRRLRIAIEEASTASQVVIFTHSPILVGWKSIVAGTEIARIYKQNGSSSLIAQPKRETLEGIRPLLEDRHNLHAFGQDATESLFLEDKVLLLEGQDDVYYLPIILEQLNREQQFNIWGWGIGGQTKLESMMHLLKELGYSHVAAILDKPDKSQKRNFERQSEVLDKEIPEFHVGVWPAPDIRTKKVKNVVKVEGVLGLDLKVRPEFRDDVESVIDGVIKYFGSDPR